ncbi:unnamed protein product [Schistocephalus solidus]|uniref:Retrotransposon hot spot (RHS) protein n=1 Tax=Schistocephalus solidus TaxID=70667 RepID=A0A183TSV0_SCHSO|nr:unnamed protein product [Schistocephalus solidus]
MYCVVEFINDQSVAAVAKSWFVDVNCVMWPKNAKQRDYLLQNNLQPPANTKIYAVWVLKDNLTLEKAKKLVIKAQEADDLISSKPTVYPSRYPCQLTSASENEEECIHRPKEPERRLAGWPTPILILHKKVDYIAEQEARNMEQIWAALNSILKEVRAKAVPAEENKTPGGN